MNMRRKIQIPGAVWLSAICIPILISVMIAGPPAGNAGDKPSQWDGWESGPFHYTGRYCKACHEDSPTGSRTGKLKYSGDYNLLCKCHSPESYVHPVDVTPEKRMADRIPAQWPLENQKITCLTCHDIHRQCSRRSVDKTSLRGAPYPKRYAFCYQCHDTSRYEPFNPHTREAQTGQTKSETCLYCHTTVPDEDQDSYETLEYVGDLETLCQRCHRIDGKHSGDFDHMVKPSAKTLAVMKNMETTFGIILPLDAEGQLTCITCHNPHAKGVIPADRPSAKGADEKYRHRLPERLCIECHRL